MDEIGPLNTVDACLAERAPETTLSDMLLFLTKAPDVEPLADDEHYDQYY